MIVINDNELLETQGKEGSSGSKDYDGNEVAEEDLGSLGLNRQHTVRTMTN